MKPQDVVYFRGPHYYTLCGMKSTPRRQLIRSKNQNKVTCKECKKALGILESS